MPTSIEIQKRATQSAVLERAAATSPKRNVSNVSALQPQNMLVPFDFTETSIDLLRHAAAMAASLGATLHVLHVTDTSEPADEKAAAFHAGAEPLLRHWTKTIAGDRAEVVPWVRSGSSAREIVAMARSLDIDLVLMASSCYGGLKHVLERSTADRVSRLSPCPVLTIPERVLPLQWSNHAPFTSCERVLLPIDTARPGRRALAHAAGIAQGSGATITLLNVGAHGNETFESEASKSGLDLARKVSSQFSVAVAFQAVRWHGTSPVYPILLEAKRSQADLIVLPVLRGDSFRRLRLASVADNILRHAPCPVLGVNDHPESARSGRDNVKQGGT
ncbi:MAG TPA: universal stress protein [Verrucomicrobiae bacterium]|nr:universal stress protein [Verrucomicrobiae bacterium]